MLLFFNTLLAQSNSGSIGGAVLMMVLLIAVFYFFLIRPQQKQQKKLDKKRDEMQVGDKVVTAGGIHGRIKEIGDTWFLIEVSEGVKMKFEKNCVYTSTEDVNRA